MAFSLMDSCLSQEFMLATDMTSSGSPEEKLRWAFKMYDKDGSGEWSIIRFSLVHRLSRVDRTEGDGGDRLDPVRHGGGGRGE